MKKQIDKNVTEMMASFEQVCRSRGLKFTHQRQMIFRAMVEQTDHPTTEEVYNRVRKDLSTISLDTVYRTIATFEEYGLVKRVLHLDNKTRFDININVHHHLVCTQCNKIEDFYWPDFDRMQLPREISGWGEVDMKQVVINGLCSTCKNNN